MSLVARLRSVMLRPNSLGQRAVNATIWSAADLAVNNALRLLSNLILTRILLPEAFGAVAIVTTIQSGLLLLTDLAIHRSIVQSPLGEDDRFLRVCWAVQVVWRIVLSVLVVAAGLIFWLLASRFASPGTVYADPELPGLIIVSSLTMLVSGFESTNIWRVVRKMQLGRITLLNALGQVVSIVANVLFTFVSASAWAIVWGTIATSIARVVFSNWILEGPRMRFEWDRQIASELWRTGRWLLVSSLFTFLSSNADRLILGGVLNSELFGYYTIAGVWVQAASLLVARLSDPVAFSAFSESRRSNPARTPSVYRRLRAINDLARIAAFVGLILFGFGVLRFLYTERYFEVVAAFIPILAVTLLASRLELQRMFILSSGDSLTTMYTSALRTVALIVLMPLGFLGFGTAGALLGSALSPLGAAPLLAAKIRTAMGRRELYVEIAATLFVIAAAAVVYALFGGAVNEL